MSICVNNWLSAEPYDVISDTGEYTKPLPTLTSDKSLLYNNDLTDITKIHVFETSGTASASGVVSLPSKLTGKKVLSVEVYGANSNGASAIGLGDLGCRLVTVNGSNELIALSNGSAGLRWTYID